MVDISVGLIIGAMLYKKNGRIISSDLDKVKFLIKKYATKYYVDFSRDSIISGVQDNSDCFMFDDSNYTIEDYCIGKQRDIILNNNDDDFYINHMGRIKRYFYDVLDKDIRKAIDMI